LGVEWEAGGERVRRIWKLFWRGVFLRCPSCGRATLVRGVLCIHERCRVCGLAFEHDQGFFLGALIVNYLIAFFLGILPAIVLVAAGGWSVRTAIIVAVAASLLLPVVFYWHAKSLWMAIYYIFVPDDLRAARLEALAAIEGGPGHAEPPEPRDEAERQRRQLEEALAELEGGKPIYRRGAR
jgi:uncharacterized protein (DUF983 family)